MKKEQRVGKEFGDYILGKTLGQGTFGKVKAATHKLTRETVAIKILEKSKISEVADVERVSREIHILKLIRHPNIVQLYEIIETPKQLLLVMEYMEQGQLFNYIVMRKRIDEKEACRMFHELINGVEYIHSIGVVHRDLKPQNILLDYKKSLRIVDFGLSNTYKRNQKLKTPCGSPCYAAPEMIKGDKYDGLKVDTWSCGVILFAMLCGYLPFEDPDTPSLYKKILSGTYTFQKGVSEQARDLIQKILTGDHTARPTIECIRGHQWMKQYDIKQCENGANRGIVVGVNKIPIDQSVISQMHGYEYESDYVVKCLQANRHNNVTTTYYLSLKKQLRDGTSCQRSSKSLQKAQLDLQRRRSVNHNVVLENFLTRNSEQPRRKSKDKQIGKDPHSAKDCHRSKECQEINNSGINYAVTNNISSNSINNITNNNITHNNITHNSINISTTQQDKENRGNNITLIHVATETKKQRVSSKNRINCSFNYGKMPLSSKSVQRNSVRRQCNIENRISRKYKEKFNRSLLSKSKDKIQPSRSRIPSSVQGCKKEIHDVSTMLVEDYVLKCKKMKKLGLNLSKPDTGKVIKGKRV